MSDIAISVEHVSKKFRLGTGSGASSLSEWLQGLVVGHSKTSQPSAKQISPTEAQRAFWALDDVTFTVNQGEILGIIGRNGAGKSTLLKILSKITRPTAGRVGTRGRVGSLLEVGTGFHPELTGQENVFLNGSILGMSRREIQHKFEEIVAFAEIDEFIKTPVKRYSSGMYTRLAFSVAAHLEPEILIIDEVLAVGDAAFQKKCLGKMNEVARHGRTVLFVSHNLTAVKSLCHRGVLLDRGRCLAQGPIDEVVSAYHQQVEDENSLERHWSPEKAPGNEQIRIHEFRLQPIDGEVITIRTGLQITFRMEIRQPQPPTGCLLQVETLESLLVFQQGTSLGEQGQLLPGWYEVSVEIPPDLLNQGAYRLNLIFAEYSQTAQFRMDDILRFEVVHEGTADNFHPQPGVVAPRLKWYTTRQSG